MRSLGAGARGLAHSAEEDGAARGAQARSRVVAPLGDAADDGRPTRAASAHRDDARQGQGAQAFGRQSRHVREEGASFRRSANARARTHSHARSRDESPRTDALAFATVARLPPPSQGTILAKRKAEAILRTDEAHHRVFTEMAERYANRKGGYTRVIHLPKRQSDSAKVGLAHAHAACAHAPTHARESRR